MTELRNRPGDGRVVEDVFQVVEKIVPLAEVRNPTDPRAALQALCQMSFEGEAAPRGPQGLRGAPSSSQRLRAAPSGSEGFPGRLRAAPRGSQGPQGPPGAFHQKQKEGSKFPGFLLGVLPSK